MNRPEKAGVPLHKTRAVILTHLLSEDLTALDLENKIGINESAIRRHLDTLQKQGLVENYFEKASRGRPKKKYTITSDGEKVFPQKTHRLFVLLAEVIRKKYGKDEIEKILSEVADKFAQELSPDGEDMTTEEKLEELINSLDEFGFYPQTWEENGSHYIKYRNCVFADVVDNFSGELCDMHKEVLSNVMSNCKVIRESSVGKGDEICLHRIEINSS